MWIRTHNISEIGDFNVYQLIVLVMYLQRMGTCGGIGLQPGTVVVTEEAVDGTLRPYLDTVLNFDFFF